MNCFDLQNRASDFLDGNLTGSQKTEADQHLDDCRDCSERYKRYRIILTSISSQPRSALPIPIRKSPHVRRNSAPGHCPTPKIPLGPDSLVYPHHS